MPGWFVTITEMPNFLTGLDLVEYCMGAESQSEPIADLHGVVLPQWKLQQEVDVSWCKHIHTTDITPQTWRLVQALMEGKSSFGAWGTGFAAAFAGGATREYALVSKIPKPTDHVVTYDLAYALWHEESPIPFGAVGITTDSFSMQDVTETEN